MLTYEMIKNSTISENTFGEMAFIIKNKNIFDCDECELLEIMLDLIADKISVQINVQDSTIEHLEELATEVDCNSITDSINKCSLKKAVLKEVRNMIYEL